MVLVRVEDLPEEPLAAAAFFYAHVLPGLAEKVSGEGAALTLHFAPADHSHRGWRSEVVAGLARAMAPCRVNGLAGGDEAAIAAALAWLERVPGVTGQLMHLDEKRAGTEQG